MAAAGALGRRATAGAGPAGAAAHESFLVHRRFRWLKAATLLVLSSLVPYLAWAPPEGHNGGSRLGYALGTAGALLIVWLMLLGVRKRRYGPGAFSLKGWLSAHVYLGTALLVVATLHAGFQVGWNVHTLAYALMVVVIASGMVGVVLYARLPRLMTENRASQTTAEMLGRIRDLDRESAHLAMGLPNELGQAVQRSRAETRLGGSAWRILSGRDRRCPTAAALAATRRLEADLPAELRPQAQDLVLTLARKDELLRRLRQDLRRQALLELWLLVHVPFSFALLAALVAHIVAVFFYWG